MASRRWLAVLTACLSSLFLGMAAVSTASDQAGADATFTIKNLVPDPEKRELLIELDHEVPWWELSQELRFLPPVAIESWNTRQADTANAFIVKGAFRYGVKHHVILPDGFTVAGQRYVKTVDIFVMPHRKAALSYVTERSVIELMSKQLLHVRVVNADEIVFHGLRLPAVLLPLTQTEKPIESKAQWDETMTLLRRAASSASTVLSGAAGFRPFLGDVFEERQLFYTAGDDDTQRQFTMPLQFRKDKERGVLELVRITDNRAGGETASEARLYRITDLGITYKIAQGDLLVWVTSLHEAVPVGGASVLAVTQEAQLFVLGKTGGDGVLAYKPRPLDGFALTPAGEFTPIAKNLEPAQIRFLAVATDRDVSFIQVEPSVDLAPDAIQQVKTIGEAPRMLRGQVFTERGIYRPGDTVHFKGVVREYVDGKVSLPKETAVLFEVTNSKEEKVYSGTAPLSEFGTAWGDLKVLGYFPLGTYTLALGFGPDNSLKAERTFQVQEFREPRHFVEIAFEQRVKPDRSVVSVEREQPYLAVTIAGKYYAGGPVKHGQVRWKIYHASTEQDVKGYEAHSFGYPVDKREELLEGGEAVLDEAGAIQIEFPLDGQVAGGMRGLDIVGTVVDFDGRASTDSRVFQVRPDVLVGIGAHPDSIKGGDPLDLGVVVVDAQGKAVDGDSVAATVMRYEWFYIKKRNDEGNVYWSWQNAWRKKYGSEVRLEHGRGAFSVDTEGGGKYLVSFTYKDPRGRTFTSAATVEVEGDYYGWEYEAKDRPYESLQISTDREAYRPGDTARLKLSSRRPVKTYLVTVDRNAVLEYRVVTAGVGETDVSIPISSKLEPNVVVSALGVAPRGDYPLYPGGFDDDAPAFQFGNKNLLVQAEAGKGIEIAIEKDKAKLEARPGDEVGLDLQALDAEGKPARVEMAVGVVNESVLALTGYTTPALDDLLKFTLPLSVFTGELRRLLLLQTPFDWVRNEPLTGGDGLAPGERGMETRIRKDFNPVAFFNPAVVTGADGKARITFKLPDTMTTYRVFVVACDKNTGFASAQKPLLAVQPFYLEPGLPRFFTRGDRFAFQVSAFNQTDDAGAMNFSVTSSGGLKLTAPKPSFSLKPHDSAVVRVSGDAADIGPAKALFKADFAGKSDAVELMLPIRSRHAEAHHVVLGTLAGTRTVPVSLPEAFIKAAGAPGASGAPAASGEMSASLVLTGTPFLRLSEGLQYFLHYPYGCVEQTSSGLIPLAAVRDLAKRGTVPGVEPGKVDDFIDKGLQHLLAMQTDSGGFGYWPGHREADPWGSIYAGSALVFLKEAGVAVPEARMTRFNDYLTAKLNDDTLKDQEWRPFAAWILAAGGALQPDVFSRVSVDFASHSRAGKLLILLAGKASGHMPPGELAMLARGVVRQPWERNRQASYHARYREPALALLAGLAILPGEPATNEAAGVILEGMDARGIWTSTSDSGWCLFALARYMKGVPVSEGRVAVTVSHGGKPLGKLEFGLEEHAGLDLDPAMFLADATLTLETAAQAPLLYKITINYPQVDWSAAGQSAGFTVAKEIKNTDGSSVIKMGDIVEVRVTLSTADYGYEYVMLDDPLPAGLVAINTALKTEEPQAEESSARGSGFDDYWGDMYGGDGGYRFQPNFFEIRDDRVLASRNYLWKGTFVFSYQARAVCEGEFIMPPTTVALMYQPGVSGRTAQGRIRIEARTP